MEQAYLHCHRHRLKLERQLASAQVTITGDGKVIDQYREQLASVTEERDSLKLALDATYELNREHIAYLEQQLAASREAVPLIQAARELVDETNWVRGMRNDDPNKGSGNRLADALDKYDRALSASAAKR